MIAPLGVTVHAFLKPDPAEQAAIDATLEAFNKAVLHAMEAGRRLQTRSNAVIHRHCYRELRAAFGLSANLAVRAIARAAQRLKDPTAAEPDSRSIDYDARTLSISPEAATVSLSTVQGRLRQIGMVLEAGQRLRLQGSHVLHAVLWRTPQNTYRLTITLAPKHVAE